jgi:flavin reductase (DIM6/NTAB) family NADH-FMN oxidoreductase RutF/rubredoxin
MDSKALYKISYGLYIVSSRKDNKINGQIANAIFQITAEPKTIALSINRENLTHEYINHSNVCAVSILSQQAPMPFIGTFGFKSGRDINKFQNVNYKLGATKTPIILDHTLAYIEASIMDKIDVGTHTIFIGKVEDADILDDEKPMTYEFYRKVKGGVSPKNAPTYSSHTNSKGKNEGKRADRYVCTVCGYVYDSEKGDPDNGIPPGTQFDDLPEDWVCPVCGANKDAFERE